MNVELFIYLKLYLLGMFKVSHLDKEATRHEKWTQLTDPFFFLSFFCPKILRIFFNICGQHCLYSLNYSVARPGAGEAYWLIYIILHFSFRAHRFMLNKTWKFKVSCSLLFFEMTAEMNEIITWETFLPRRYLKKGVVSVMGSFLSNDNGKKNRWKSKITSLHVHRLLLYISLPSSHNFDVKLPNFSFYVKRELSNDFSFSFSYLRNRPLEKNSSIFEKVNELELSWRQRTSTALCKLVWNVTFIFFANFSRFKI